jgi:phospholipid-binding lipoprotein MlaA
MKFVNRFRVLLLVLALTGCASTHNPNDPLESFNRAMFSFNDSLDQAALKPAAKLYEAILPTFVQTAIGNFFGNLGDIWTAVNNLLQGKVADGVTDVMRVAINSTFGLGGLINIASEAGMPKHKEDFGQTLGKWGVGAGPYIVLPFLGSSTIRDTVALPVDFKGDLWSYKEPERWRHAGSVVRLVDQRAAALGASTLIEEAALDRYEFVRDAFLQRRESKVFDDGDRASGAMPGREGDVQAKLDQKVPVNSGGALPAPESVAMLDSDLEEMLDSDSEEILESESEDLQESGERAVEVQENMQFGKEELALSEGDEEDGELDDLM